jgi:hypothetical protein
MAFFILFGEALFLLSGLHCKKNRKLKNNKIAVTGNILRDLPGFIN